MQRGVALVYCTIFLLALWLMISPVSAQETDGDLSLEELEEEFTDEELDEALDAGLTPDSPFYFIDKWFDSEDSRAEKIAEIRAMVREGKTAEAREALEEYKKHAKALEDNPDPRKREAARRDAAAIQKALKELDSAEFNDEFENILETEKELVTAVEIASKIKELCETLHETGDLELFYRTCKTESDSPGWQKNLFDDLSAEQEQEARKFFRIMTQCFEDINDCQCGEITASAFAEKCEEVIPLEKECQEGNEDACDQVDKLTEDIEQLLPPHLQRVLEEIEEQFDEAEFDRHMPRECKEAGITPNQRDAREKCEEILIRAHAPEECVEAFDRGEVQFDGEREFHEKCEEILFQVHAPDECKEAGLTDHEECGKLLFQKEAPQECRDAGLTGEHRDDNRKCDEIMRRIGEKDFNKPRFNCGEIKDPEKRLACYDGALEDSRDFKERFKETKERERECTDFCSNEGAAWSFENGECECHFPDHGFDDEEFDEHENFEDVDEFDEEFEEEFPQDAEEEHEENTQEESQESTDEQQTEENQDTEEEPAEESPTEEQTEELATTNTLQNNIFLNYYYR